MNMQITYYVWIKDRSEPFEIDATKGNLKRPIFGDDGSIVFVNYPNNDVSWRFNSYEVFRELVETW